jgi:hypothetical protein
MKVWHKCHLSDVSGRFAVQPAGECNTFTKKNAVFEATFYCSVWIFLSP